MTRRSFDEVNRMFDELNRVFDEMRRDLRDNDWTRGTVLDFNGVSLDLQEHEDEYSLVGDLPGFEIDEIDITYRDGTITIDATHDIEDDGHSRRGSVHESITIPSDIILEESTATYRNGVLEINLLMADPTAVTSHQIDVTED